MSLFSPQLTEGTAGSQTLSDLPEVLAGGTAGDLAGVPGLPASSHQWPRETLSLPHTLTRGLARKLKTHLTIWGSKSPHIKQNRTSKLYVCLGREGTRIQLPCVWDTEHWTRPPWMEAGTAPSLTGWLTLSLRVLVNGEHNPHPRVAVGERMRAIECLGVDHTWSSFIPLPPLLGAPGDPRQRE